MRTLGFAVLDSGVDMESSWHALEVRKNHRHVTSFRPQLASAPAGAREAGSDPSLPKATKDDEELKRNASPDTCPIILNQSPRCQDVLILEHLYSVLGRLFCATRLYRITLNPKLSTKKSNFGMPGPLPDHGRAKVSACAASTHCPSIGFRVLEGSSVLETGFKGLGF